MEHHSKINSKKWLVVCGILLFTSFTSIASSWAAGLNETEKYWLTYMREEEKLARDVYLFLYAQWGTRIFDNIAASEQKHMNAIKTLLDRYGVPDPAAGKGLGEFSDPGLQNLYNVLTEQGSASLVEALKVGVTIEETDIEDLAEAIASTRPKAIRTVYSNLLRGSLNHLKAFVSRLAVLGVLEQP